MVYLSLLDKLAIKYKKNHSLKSHTTFKVGGNALLFIEPTTIRELQHAISILSSYGVKYKILGNGSNILVSDKGYNGAIISTKKINFIYIDENQVSVSCGTNLNSLIIECKKNGLSGLEKLYGIPATIGGALTMNASAFNTSISDRLESVLALKDDKPIILEKQDCSFSYRKSRFLSEKYAILSANFVLNKCDANIILENIKHAQEYRKIHQPSSRSCGSVFKNTGFAPAWLLIDKCGLKGYALGNANVSSVHANFINAKNDCTAKEIYNLILEVKRKVKEKFNVSLIEEVEYIGEF